MLTQPENSVKFTDEQSAQLESWRKRVFVAQEELSLRENRLKEIRSETLRAVTDLEYQKKLLSEVSVRVDEIRKVEEDTKKSVALATADLHDLSKQKTDISASNEAKKAELKNREKDVAEKEKNVTSKINEADKKLKNAIEKEEKVNKAEKQLKAALSNIWK